MSQHRNKNIPGEVLNFLKETFLYIAYFFLLFFFYGRICADKSKWELTGTKSTPTHWDVTNSFSCKEWYCTALLTNRKCYTGARHRSVHPWYRHPLRGRGGTLHGLLHTFHALIHVVVDKNHIKEMSVCGENDVRLFLDHLQVLRLGHKSRKVKQSLDDWVWSPKVTGVHLDEDVAPGQLCWSERWTPPEAQSQQSARPSRSALREKKNLVKNKQLHGSCL